MVLVGHRIYRKVGKRLFDVVVSLALIVLTLPLQTLVSVIVRVKLGPPVLFSQVRPGLAGRPFRLIKYRTMTDERDDAGRLRSDSLRLTPVGRLLRSSSLDELPEFYSVVKGDMSLVGPRPLLSSYVNRYTPRQARRHEVRPGITGLAQVNGRNRISWEEKFDQDVYYVDNVSLRLDLKILWLTLVATLRRIDVDSDGHATAPEFMGSDPTRE